MTLLKILVYQNLAPVLGHVKNVKFCISANEKIDIKDRKNQQAVAGEPWKMVCETNAMPQLHIKWLKNGLEVTPEDEKHEIRAQFSEGLSTLHFNSVSETDSGDYVCCAVQNEKLTSYPNDCQMISKVATLNVAPGNWLVRPAPMVTYKPGQDVRIQCIPTELEAQVQWRQLPEGFELRTNSRLDDRISVDSNNTLIIKTVASGDQGDYECSFADTKAVSYLTVLGKFAEFPSLSLSTRKPYLQCLTISSRSRAEPRDSCRVIRN